MSKIKVLQVNKLYYPVTGGIEKVIQNIAEGLNEETDMQVLVCQKKGRGCSEMIRGVRVVRSSSFGVLFSLPLSLRFLWDFRVLSRGKDIVEIHVPFPLADLACLLSGYKGKVIVHWQSDIVKQKRLMFLYRPIMERFLERADMIIVAAKGIMEGSSYLKPYKHKCVMIPLAVDPEMEKKGKEYLDRCKADGMEVVEDKGGAVRFLFVGRLVYYKGVDVLLEAVKDLEHAYLTIVGSGQLEESLKEYVALHHMSERVEFLGSVDDAQLQKEFEKCDVFVLPSVAKSEAFGLVQLEAMAYGKPVINTNLPSGVPEVSLHGITGRTAKPGDVQTLKESMDWMIRHPEERLEMGKAARKRLEEEFTQKVMLKRVMQAYQKVLGRP